jgi:hypothetical protein
MWRKIPDQVDDMATNIGQVEDIREELAEQATAIEDAVLDVAKTDLQTYLQTTKLAELQLVWPEVPGSLGPLYIVFGGTYGTIDYSTGGIHDWEYRQDNLVPSPPIPPSVIPGPPSPAYYVRYVYTPGDDSQIDTWVNDYAYGNDYLTKPLDLSGTYGLYKNIDQLDDGLGVLNANKDALAGGEDVFSRYIP